MFAQESGMDLQKEREAFEKECRLLCYKGNMVMSNLGSFYNNEQTNWMWQMWLSAKAQAVPEGFVLVPKENISCYWQDNDEPENFCSNESDFDCLGDCIDLGEIMEINKFTQAHVNKEILFGTWFAEAIDPSEKANFFVGTHAECLEIVAKNKAMIEAQGQK